MFWWRILAVWQVYVAEVSNGRVLELQRGCGECAVASTVIAAANHGSDRTHLPCMTLSSRLIVIRCMPRELSMYPKGSSLLACPG